MQVQDNAAERQFEVKEEGHTAYLRYRKEKDFIVLIHTEVPASLEGRGIGSALAKAALDSARQNGLKVIPECEFVQSYLKRHPEYQDLV